MAEVLLFLILSVLFLIMNDIKIKTLVSKNIVTAIKYCGTQTKLAKKAGITQGAVSKYKRGDAIPTYMTAQKLSKAVDKTQPISDFAPYVTND